MSVITQAPEKYMNQHVTVGGMADDAHQGAVVVLSDNMEVYVRGLSRWDKTLRRKGVKVTGFLRYDKIAPDPEVNAKGEVSHGMIGGVLILEEPKWEAWADWSPE